MVKITVLLKRKPGMSSEDFFRYWSDTHGPLMTSVPEFMRHCRRYIQSHVIEGAKLDFPAAFADYDGYAELWFDDLDSLNRALNEPRYLGELIPDMQEFLDLESLRVLVTKEVPQHNPRA